MSIDLFSFIRFVTHNLWGNNALKKMFIFIFDQKRTQGALRLGAMVCFILSQNLWY